MSNRVSIAKIKEMNTHWRGTNLCRPNASRSSFPGGPNFPSKSFLIFRNPPLISPLESGPRACAGRSPRSPVLWPVVSVSQPATEQFDRCHFPLQFRFVVSSLPHSSSSDSSPVWRYPWPPAKSPYISLGLQRVGHQAPAMFPWAPTRSSGISASISPAARGYPSPPIWLDERDGWRLTGSGAVVGGCRLQSRGIQHQHGAGRR